MRKDSQTTLKDISGEEYAAKIQILVEVEAIPVHVLFNCEAMARTRFLVLGVEYPTTHI